MCCMYYITSTITLTDKTFLSLTLDYYKQTTIRHSVKIQAKNGCMSTQFCKNKTIYQKCAFLTYHDFFLSINDI